MIKLDSLLKIAISILPEMGDCEKKHFTFITRKNNILALGLNRPFKTHPTAKLHGYRYSGIHSELDAINRLPYGTDFKRCYLINMRLSADSLKRNRPILRMSKPCPKCLPWILGMGFRDVLYTDDSGFLSLKGLNENSHRGN